MTPETSHLNDAIEMVTKPVISAGESVEHVMVLHLDPCGDGKAGVIRCIVNRTGDVGVSGHIDHSQIHPVEMTSSFQAHKGPELDISETDAVVSRLAGGENYDFLGLEDPNI